MVSDAFVPYPALWFLPLSPTSLQSTTMRIEPQHTAGNTYLKWMNAEETDVGCSTGKEERCFIYCRASIFFMIVSLLRHGSCHQRLKWKTSQVLTVLGHAPTPILGLFWLPCGGKMSIQCSNYSGETPVRSHNWLPAAASVYRRDRWQRMPHGKPMGDVPPHPQTL